MTSCTLDDCMMLNEITDLKTRVSTLEQNVATRASVSALNTKIDGMDRKLDTLIDGIRIGKVVPDRKRGKNGDKSSLLPWDPNEDTGLHAAPTWAQRSREAAGTAEILDAERERLAIENAALKAAAQERTKISQRRRADMKEKGELTIKKWKIVAGLMTAILGSGVATALVSWLLTQ